MLNFKIVYALLLMISFSAQAFADNRQLPPDLIPQVFSSPMLCGDKTKMAAHLEKNKAILLYQGIMTGSNGTISTSVWVLPDDKHITMLTTAVPLRSCIIYSTEDVEPNYEFRMLNENKEGL